MNTYEEAPIPGTLREIIAAEFAPVIAEPAIAEPAIAEPAIAEPVIETGPTDDTPAYPPGYITHDEVLAIAEGKIPPRVQARNSVTKACVEQEIVKTIAQNMLGLFYTNRYLDDVVVAVQEAAESGLIHSPTVIAALEALRTARSGPVVQSPQQELVLTAM